MHKDFGAEKRRTIKVLLVVRWPGGGIRTFLKYLIKAFPDDNYKFYLVGADIEGLDTLKKELGPLVTDWIRFPNEGNILISCYQAVRKTLKNNEFDLIHAHGFTSAMSTWLPGKLARIPIVFTSHDVLMPDQFLGLKGELKKIALSFTLNRYQIVHSVSKDAQANLQAMLPRINRKKILVILNGVDATHFFNSEKRNLKLELEVPEDIVLIGFFGRFMNQKGFKHLIDAIDILKTRRINKDVHIACFGSGAFIREEKAEIERRGLIDSFTFIPFTSDVSGAMKGCDIIAMPSLWEACPLQPMEALCAGIPFVGSDCIGLREVLSGTPAISVKKGDSESLADGIIECLEKGEQPFVDFAPEAVKRFDVRKTAEQIHQMYERILG